MHNLNERLDLTRDLHRIFVFREVVRQSGFSSAARSLGVTPASVSRIIAAFEEQLGVRLFRRTTRRFSLTEEGEKLHDRLHGILDQLEASIAFTRENMVSPAAPAGMLKISLPSSYGKFYIMPRLSGFMDQYPDILPDICFNDEPFDIIDKGIDVAVCYGSPVGAEYVTRIICRPVIKAVASPAYLENVGWINAPTDLHKCRYLAARGMGPDLRPLIFTPGRGGPAETFVHPPLLRLDSTEGVILGAIHGLGVTAAASYAVDDLIGQGILVQLFPDYVISAADAAPVISVTYANRHHVSPRIRVFVDYLTDISR